MLSKFWRRLRSSKNSKQTTDSNAVFISKRQHDINKQKISRNAIKVIQRLNSADYPAYLVGGGVRDILLQKSPKDFDVSTSAKPEQIRRLFRNCRLIGRRFRLAHIYFKGEIIEVSTFRGGQTSDATLAHDNEYGSIEEDAWRRDFTVNALYLRVSDLSILDYTGGIDDLDKRLLRIIGDAEKRYHEDPVRVLRAIRLAGKLDLNIEEQTAAQIKPCLHLLDLVPAARIFDEVLKILFQGHAVKTIPGLKKFGVWQKLFPLTAKWQDDSNAQKLFDLALHATDDRVRNNKSLNPGFLLAVLFYPELDSRFAEFKGEKKQFLQLRRLANTVIAEQIKMLRIPKRLQIMMIDIWLLQLHLERRRSASALTLLRQRYFRAAYDLLELRAKVDVNLQSVCATWQSLRDAKPGKREEIINEWRSRSPKQKPNKTKTVNKGNGDA